MRFQLCVLALFILALLGARTATGAALPGAPPFPNFGKLTPYDPPDEKSLAEALDRAIKDFQQFVQTDLPAFRGKNEGSARRTGTHQWRLESSDGRELLFIEESQGLATALKFYRIAEGGARKLDPRLSRSVQFMDRNRMCTFSNQAGQHVTITTTGDTAQVTAYGALGIDGRVYQIRWDANGRLTSQSKAPLERLQPREMKLRSNEFTARLDPKPYQGAYSRPADRETAAALEASLRALGEDLNEMAALAQAGRMKWETNAKGQCVGRYEATDKTKIVAVALRGDQKTLMQGSSTLYDRIPEIRESMLRDATFTCHADGSGLYQYTLHTPQFETRVEYWASHAIRAFQVNWFARGESQSVVWDEKGKIQEQK